MSELLQTAKAVIERWDRSTWKTMPNMDEYICQLRAAVERAEKQEAVGIDEWLESQGFENAISCKAALYGGCVLRYAWTAAQQAERERIRDLLGQSSDWFEDNQMAQANWLLEKIDEC